CSASRAGSVSGPAACRPGASGRRWLAALRPPPRASGRWRGFTGLVPSAGPPESWPVLSVPPGRLAQPQRSPAFSQAGVAAPPATERPWPHESRGGMFRMRRYEMMIILDPALEEQTVHPSLEQFMSVVTTGGGAVDKIDVWGRRRLAYEIDKKADGIYAVVDLIAEPDTVTELDRQLSLNEA